MLDKFYKLTKDQIDNNFQKLRGSLNEDVNNKPFMNEILDQEKYQWNIDMCKEHHFAEDLKAIEKKKDTSKGDKMVGSKVTVKVFAKKVEEKRPHTGSSSIRNSIQKNVNDRKIDVAVKSQIAKPTMKDIKVDKEENKTVSNIKIAKRDDNKQQKVIRPNTVGNVKKHSENKAIADQKKPGIGTGKPGLRKDAVRKPNFKDDEKKGHGSGKNLDEHFERLFIRKYMDE